MQSDTAPERSEDQAPAPQSRPQEDLEDKRKGSQGTAPPEIKDDANTYVPGLPPTNESGDVGNISASRPPADNIPPPPLPKHSDEEANEDSDSTSGSSSDDDVATAEDLFQAYVKKFEKEQAKFPTRHQPRKKGPKLVESFVDYVNGLESRIEQLETKLGLEEESENESLPDTQSSAEFTVKFFDIAEEVQRNGSFKGERETMANTYRSLADARHFMRAAYRWRRDVPLKPLQAQENQPLNPEDIEVVSIRIDSLPISMFYQEVTKTVVGRGGLLELFKPFRSIIRNLPEIRAQLARLEEKWGSTASGGSVNSTEQKGPDRQDDHKKEPEVPTDAVGSAAASRQNPGGVETPPSQESTLRTYETPEALQHFRKLLGFMETYLEPQISLYSQIQEGKCSKISFENLWMLFNFNDTIYCPMKRGNADLTVFDGPNRLKYITRTRLTPQAYRVVFSAGGVGVIDALGSQVEDDPSIVKTEKSQDQEDTVRHEEVPVGIRERFCQLSVYCFSVSFDAHKYTPVEDLFLFKPFEGEVDITSLEAYPLRFHRSKDQVSRNLLDRGRKFVDMTSVSHLNYEGLSIGDDREEIVSSVIVDMKLAFQENAAVRPKCGPLRSFVPLRQIRQVVEVAVGFVSCPHPPNCQRGICTRDGYYEWSGISKVNPVLRRHLFEYEPDEKDQKLVREEMKKHLEAADLIQLLPGTVPGYALRNRKWVILDVDLLQPVVHDANSGWKDLVLPHGHKEIVQAMVENHAASTRVQRDSMYQTSEVDLVRGKGKGCIILIHGAPGVGKTSTAECVAAYTNRPLFPITCGDIGYQPDQVEKSLDRLFNLAHKWGCVLLLDEADVFLAKRNKEDIKRNGLVSIFLRILEYYSGILFLTTNRVGAIDDAFRSRLHLTLYYPQLDRDKTRKIWKMNIRRMKNLNAEREQLGRPQILVDKKKILKYADLNFEELHWNGRQIRNAFQSALALSDFKVRDTPGKSPTISVEQFSTIATASQEFDHYLHVTHGAGEEKIAQRDKMRGSYNQTEMMKLKSLPITDDSDSTTDDEAAKAPAPSSDSGGSSDSDSNGHSSRKKGKKKSKKRQKQKEEETKSAKKKKKKKRKGKDKDKESSKTDSDSDSDE